MSAFNVLKPNHFMLGLDFHDCKVSPSQPLPIPLVPHSVFAPLEGYVGASSVKKVKKTFAEYVPMLQRGTDIGPVIPHFCLNILLPFIIAGSASKSFFGANTVKLEGTGVGVAVLHDANINLNCGGAIGPPTPTGYVFAPCTVRAGMTYGDFIAGIVQMYVEGVIQWVIGVGLFLFTMDMPFIVGDVLGLLMGWVIGTPLGYSFKGGLLGPVYTRIEEKVHDGIADYFNDPKRRVFK